MNPPTAHRELPQTYQLAKTIDLIKQPKLFIILNVIGIGLFIACWVLLTWLLVLVRPDVGVSEIRFVISLNQAGSFLIALLVFLLVFVSMVTLHEAIHGLFFWLYTQGKVKFAFKGAYAYAAAPDWYLQKRPYMVVSMAPLIMMSIIGCVALLLVPLGWVNPLMLVITMNAAGAIGDIYVFLLLLRMPEDVLIRDFGERMELFTRSDENSVS